MLAGDLAVADPALADLPDLGHLLGVLVELHAEVSSLFRDRAGEPLSLLIGLLVGVAAEFDQQPAISVGQEFRVALEALDQLVAQQSPVEGLKPDRPELSYPRHLVRGGWTVAVADQHQGAVLRAVN